MEGNDAEILRALEAELGRIQNVRHECPGVLYVTIQSAQTFVTEEYYVVTPDAELSYAVRSYGQRLFSDPELLLFPFEDERGGRYVLDYEIGRYKVHNSLSLPEGSTLQSLATFGRERCPDYFGNFPVPMMTPWGPMLRYQTMDHGLHWIETEQRPAILSICYPICDELSDFALGLARQTEYDQCHSIDQTLGCRFFSRENSCVPIFELLESRTAWLYSGKIDKTALMNAILKYHPGYAMQYNIREQQGGHDFSGALLNLLGVQTEPRGTDENMITYTEGTGVEFYQF